MGRHTGQRGEQASKRNSMEVAEERGIAAIRRNFTADDRQIFEIVAQLLRSELVGAARLFDPESLGVTVVGFSRYSSNHRVKGPRTSDVIRVVAGTGDPVTVRLGALGVFGSGSKHKLGFHLRDESDTLANEVSSLEGEFAGRGFPLKRDYNTTEDGYAPHCSIALLYEDHVGHFTEPSVLLRLGNLLVAHIGDPEITLLPVR